MSDKRTIVIDGTEVDVDPAMTLIQACEQAGDRNSAVLLSRAAFSIAGNCRMCLVEVVGGPPKPAASCAMQVKRFAARAGGAAAGRQDQLADGEECPRGGDGVSPHQPPARLSDL
jgi:NADH-quinone oxidoreductase subunit G